MKLYTNKNGIYSLYKDNVKNESEAFDLIQQYTHLNGIQTYYFNCHEIVRDNKMGLNIDYGSWSNFFFLEY